MVIHTKHILYMYIANFYVDTFVTVTFHIKIFAIIVFLTIRIKCNKFSQCRDESYVGFINIHLQPCSGCHTFH